MSNIRYVKKNISFLETIKWIAAVCLFLCSIIESYVLRDYAFYIKSITIFFTILMSIYIAFITKLGKLAVVFGQEAYVELKKVIWPTHKDSLNTTLIIFVVTVIISLILWGLDTILVYLISLVLRL